MAFDYKKEYKEFYLPPDKPGIITVPKFNFVAVRGKGDPNSENGEYQQALTLLYGLAYTIKMSPKADKKIKGYFEYVVPPLEGFWKIEGVSGMDYTLKNKFVWTSVIRLPDFVTKADFDWAVSEAERKKKTDFSKAEFLTLEEGITVQCMHTGPFDIEPATVERMDGYAKSLGYELDFSDTRLHHEIYISDYRKTAPEKLKTVIRHPIKKK